MLTGVVPRPTAKSASSGKAGEVPGVVLEQGDQREIKSWPSAMRCSKRSDPRAAPAASRILFAQVAAQRRRKKRRDGQDDAQAQRAAHRLYGACRQVCITAIITRAHSATSRPVVIINTICQLHRQRSLPKPFKFLGLALSVD